MDKINDRYFRSLGFGVVCYIEIDNWNRQQQQYGPLLRSVKAALMNEKAQAIESKGFYGEIVER